MVFICMFYGGNNRFFFLYGKKCCFNVKYFNCLCYVIYCSCGKFLLVVFMIISVVCVKWFKLLEFICKFMLVFEVLSD